MASTAASGSGARPRFVCTITPVAFSTRRRLGRARVRASAFRSPSSSPATTRSRAAAIASRAALTATPCGTPSSEEASASTDGSSLRRDALGPASLATLDLLLPDRRLGLEAVDDLARAGERLAAVRSRDGHDHARLAQGHVAGAGLGPRRAQVVAP